MYRVGFYRRDNFFGSVVPEISYRQTDFLLFFNISVDYSSDSSRTFSPETSTLHARHYDALAFITYYKISVTILPCVAIDSTALCLVFFSFFFFVPDFFLPRLSKYCSDYLGNFESTRVVLENTRIYETFYSPNFIVFCFDCSLRESIFSSI